MKIEYITDRVEIRPIPEELRYIQRGFNPYTGEPALTRGHEFSKKLSGGRYVDGEYSNAWVQFI